MSGAERKQTGAYLDDLYQAFEARWNPTTPGWGQFLDGPPGNVQIGRYGSSAGAIALRLAGQGNSPTAERTLNVLVGWTEEDQNAEAVERRVQTLPLAMLTVGIGYLRPNSEALSAAREQLFQRRVPGFNLWGDYWIDAQHCAERPSLFVSAIVLMSLYLTQPDDQIEPRTLAGAAELQERYLRNPDKYVESDPVISTAIVLLLGRGANSAVVKDLKRFAIRPPDIARRYNYFYDYQGPNGRWKREYFIVPLELIAMLVLRRNDAPAGVRLKARAIGNSLQQRLDSVGKLMLADGERLSTLEHGFAALALQAVEIDEKSPVSLRISWLLYQVRRERPAFEKAGSWVIVVAYLLLFGNYAAVTLSELTLDGLQQLLLGACAFALGVVREPVRAVRTVLGISQ